MRKACRNRPLTENQTKRNRYLSKTRYVVEQASVRCTVNSAMRGQPISD
ncbi:putative transposase [Neisseria meningitidis 98005]|nr:putative transposase [Neisseria meningitidis 98005]